ncbi:MAG: ParB/RepB/Spo0J family partition protein [Clostridiales Family XIII bacterium]|jgi:ParB family chromosome partitioning protein|nr:ParB/RepB/Spo0J family partition protein [Clostridiales Family XIII bacterium]
MAVKKTGKKALGRGLEALFGEVSVSNTSGSSGDSKNTDEGETSVAGEKSRAGRTKTAAKASSQGKTGTGNAGANNTESGGFGINYVSIDEIKPNPAQPRQFFSDEALEGLVSSIEKHGMIQPVMIRSSKSGYELIAGERRWRAARKAGLKEIPAIIKEVSEEENALFAIIENMQREDLNPIEEAQAFRGIIDDYGLTQEEVAKSVGKSRPYIANTLRLLNLPEKVREYISEGKLSAGHANAIGAVSDDDTKRVLADQIVREGLSVREAEALANLANSAGKPKKKVSSGKGQKNPELVAIEEELTTLFGTKVTLSKSVHRGTVEIHYFSKDELDGLIEELRRFRE